MSDILSITYPASRSALAKAGPGPWDNEPDKIHWIDERTDMDCLIVRGPMGGLCGYVAVPPGHPLHGKSYNDDAVPEFDVHGGITFSDKCGDGPKDRICHVPSPGRPHDVWWFGFDCTHAGDLSPYSVELNKELAGIARMYGREGEVYRTVAYVRGQCESLAAQLKELG